MFKNISKKAGVILAIGVVGAVGIPVIASADSGSSFLNDQITSGRAFTQLQQAQPTPTFKWSQERETLIDIEIAQANDTQTTTFGFNQGISAPAWSCPSLGVPIASDTQLTNPSSVYDDPYPSVQDGNGASDVVPQGDPTGVYTGASTGTYVLCIAPDGSKYVQYWEGFVDSVTGPAVWNASTGNIQLTGPSTVQVKTKVGTDNRLKKGKK